MKKVLIILGSIGVLVLIFMGSVKLLVTHIYGRTDCDRFNIDNIELRTGIDIPKIQSNECECSDGMKKNTFILDLPSEKLGHYIKRNRFTMQNGLLTHKGENDDSKWEAILLPNEQQLTVELYYKN